MNKQYKHLFTFSIIIFYIIFIMMGCATIKELKTPPIKDFGPSEYIQTECLKIDNDTSLNQLLTKEYDLCALETFFGENFSQGAGTLTEFRETKHPTLQEVNLQFPVQCLRYNSNTHYSVYKVKQGGLYYIFWMITESEDEIRVLSSTYIKKLPTLSRFRDIIKHCSTVKDVFEIDSSMEINFLASSVLSYTRLSDGRGILIEYSHKELNGKEDLVVRDITLYSEGPVPGAYISSVLPKDIPNQSVNNQGTVL